MMKTLKLDEGDRLRVSGASLPKGKFVKLQAQETSFVEVCIFSLYPNNMLTAIMKQVSDPKTVLEQALRNFTCLTQGDIIEICYNTIAFGLLVMETRTTSQNGPPCRSPFSTSKLISDWSSQRPVLQRRQMSLVSPSSIRI